MTESFTINGFDIPVVNPDAYYFVLEWQNDKTTCFPATTLAEALGHQSRINLRYDLMSRLEIRDRHNDTLVTLWDVSWPTEEYADMLSFPTALAEQHRLAVLRRIDEKKGKRK